MNMKMGKSNALSAMKLRKNKRTKYKRHRKVKNMVPDGKKISKEVINLKTQNVIGAGNSAWNNINDIGLRSSIHDERKGQSSFDNKEKGKATQSLKLGSTDWKPCLTKNQPSYSPAQDATRCHCEISAEPNSSHIRHDNNVMFSYQDTPKGKDKYATKLTVDKFRSKYFPLSEENLHPQDLATRVHQSIDYVARNSTDGRRMQPLIGERLLHASRRLNVPSLTRSWPSHEGSFRSFPSKSVPPCEAGAYNKLCLHDGDASHPAPPPAVLNETSMPTEMHHSSDRLSFCWIPNDCREGNVNGMTAMTPKLQSFSLLFSEKSESEAPCLSLSTSDIPLVSQQFQQPYHQPELEHQSSSCFLPEWKQVAVALRERPSCNELNGLPLNSHGELVTPSSLQPTAFKTPGCSNCKMSSCWLPAQNRPLFTDIGEISNKQQKPDAEGPMTNHYLDLFPEENSRNAKASMYIPARLGVDEITDESLHVNRKNLKSRRNSSMKSEIRLLDQPFNLVEQNDDIQAQIRKGMIPCWDNANCDHLSNNRPTMRLMGKDVPVGTINKDFPSLSRRCDELSIHKHLPSSSSASFTLLPKADFLNDSVLQLAHGKAGEIQSQPVCNCWKSLGGRIPESPMPEYVGQANWLKTEGESYMKGSAFCKFYPPPMFLLSNDGTKSANQSASGSWSRNSRSLLPSVLPNSQQVQTTVTQHLPDFSFKCLPQEAWPNFLKIPQPYHSSMVNNDMDHVSGLDSGYQATYKSNATFKERMMSEGTEGINEVFKRPPCVELAMPPGLEAMDNFVAQRLSKNVPNKLWSVGVSICGRGRYQGYPRVQRQGDGARGLPRSHCTDEGLGVPTKNVMETKLKYDCGFR